MCLSLYTLWGKLGPVLIKPTEHCNYQYNYIKHLKGVGWKQTPSETHLFTVGAADYNREKGKSAYPPTLSFICTSFRHFWLTMYISLVQVFITELLLWLYYFKCNTHLYKARKIPFYSMALGQLKWEHIDSFCHKEQYSRMMHVHKHTCIKTCVVRFGAESLLVF